MRSTPRVNMNLNINIETKKWLGPMMLVALLGGCGQELRLEILAYPSDTADTQGPYRIDVLPTPSDPEEIAELALEVTFQPAGDDTLVPMEPGAGGAWVGGIPGRPAGSTIEFRVKLVESGGELIRVPEEAPLRFRIISQ